PLPAQAAAPGLLRSLSACFRRAALQYHPPRGARHRHDLVQPLPALVPRAAAGVAPRALVERQLRRLGYGDAERVHLLVVVLVLLLALDAPAPDRALPPAEVHHAAALERLDGHG